MEPDQGTNFPLTGEDRRSTTVTAKRVLSEALRAVDSEAATEVEREDAWRKRYPRHYRRLVEAGLASPEAAERIAADGLQALYREMVFLRGADTMSIHDAMTGALQTELHTAIVEGRSEPTPHELSVPYDGRHLSGKDLLRQIDDWEVRGVFEPSCGDALRLVQANPGWLDLSDQTIVLLGAGAEMGPFGVFNRCRANLVAVDLNRPRVWERLISEARAGNSRLIFPLRSPHRPELDDSELASLAGADLIAETPEIAAWLATLEGPLTVGGYAYLDGGQHVRVALAMDAIMEHLSAQRNDTSIALLPTPSDVYAVPREAAEMAQRRFRERSREKKWQGSFRALSGNRLFTSNVDELLRLAPGKETGIVDSLVVGQGPNYALAKRLQRWRATTARRQGLRVSSNVAPSTKTLSVVRSRVLAAAHAGGRYFGIEGFEPDTSNALMAALLVHDLRHEGAAANPAVSLDHPAELFMQGALHGGLWRAAFSPRSAMWFAVLLGWRTAGRNR